MSDDTFRGLATDLSAVFARGVDGALPAEQFDELARRVFRWQYEANPVYRRFADGRDASPASVERWSQVPAVPATAFKHVRLVAGDEGAVERVFRTSGTTRGADRRGEHHVLDTGLYRASLLPNFRAHLLPDDASLPVVSLIPSPARAPDSSLSFMTGVVADELGAAGGGWFVDPEEGIDLEGLHGALAEAERRGRPVLVVATAFALVHWLDAARERGWTHDLPDGSRIMETGGFKGRSRALSRPRFYDILHRELGVPRRRIVNEYGMTELLSQFYEPVMLEGGPPDVEARRHRPPPWVRTRVLDPRTLEPVEVGEPGVLCHMDLANLGSVAHVLTEDRGVAVDDGFRVLGRIEGAEARGCSLAMDELLSVAGRSHTGAGDRGDARG